MKLSIERAALLKSLAMSQSVVERRNTIPILSNVLIEAEDGKLSLSATDLDIDHGRTQPDGGCRSAGRHHRAGAHALRHRPQAARGRQVALSSTSRTAAGW